MCTYRFTSEERTKKILSAVREGLHKLSDMRNDVPAQSTTPGLSTFYNQFEEIITSDNWGDEEIYSKGVMEEIQVSVQKLSKSRTPDGSLFESHEKIERRSTDAQTDFPPLTQTAEIDAIKSTYETRIVIMQETVMKEKRAFEQSVNDLNQQVMQLSQKSQADQKFIEEISQERDSEREEMLKLTSNLEKTWVDNDKLNEKIKYLKTSCEETENQLRITTAQNELLETLRKRFIEDLQVRQTSEQKMGFFLITEGISGF